MVEYHQDGTLRATYDYDAQGQRIRKRLMRPNADGVRSIRFVYDTDGRLVSETSRRDDRAALQARDLVWLGGLPLAQVERRVRPNGMTRQTNVLSLHADHLGAPREARDESGTVTRRWTRDAFGAGVNGRRIAGVERDPDGDRVKTEVSLRFSGQYHDRESGLFYNHHRDYDPVLGRYIQSNPIGLGGGVNQYAYVGGDPVNCVDPTGLAYEVVVWGSRRKSFRHATLPYGYGSDHTGQYSGDYGAQYADAHDGYEDWQDAREDAQQDEIVVKGTRQTPKIPQFLGL